MNDLQLHALFENVSGPPVWGKRVYLVLQILYDGFVTVHVIPVFRYIADPGIDLRGDSRLQLLLPDEYRPSEGSFIYLQKLFPYILSVKVRFQIAVRIIESENILRLFLPEYTDYTIFNRTVSHSKYKLSSEGTALPGSVLLSVILSVLGFPFSRKSIEHHPDKSGQC